NAFDIGSASFRWRNGYFSQNVFIAGAPAVTYPQTQAEITAGVTPVNLVYPVGTIDRYGTNTTPGTTVMLPAITAAVNVIRTQERGAVTFLNGSVYFVGNVVNDGKSTPLISATGLANTVFNGNGSQIIANTTALVNGCVFQFVNPSNVSM